MLAGLLTAIAAAVAAWAGVGATAAAYVWASPIGAQLAIGADRSSAAFLMLTGVSFAAGAAASGAVRSPRAYFALWSLLQAAVSGVFVARDLVLFLACWDAILAPLALLMWHWGGTDRRAATRRLVWYWMAASVPLLTAIVALGVGARTFSFADLSGYRLAEGSQVILAVLFLAAFAARLPLFPFHAWLPRAYVAAPLPVVLVLSSVISKTAAYAIVRICLPFFPRGMADVAPYAIGLATVGTLYGALLATRQRDTRLLIAYASVSQLSFVALGAFVATPDAVQGVLVASISHGLVVAALVLLAGTLARRAGSFSFGAAGLGSRAPVLTSLVLIAMLAAIGVPGTSGAPGELLILAAAFARAPGIGALAVLVIVLSAGYCLALLRSVLSGPGDVRHADIGWRDRALVIPLLALVVAIGVAPRAIGDLAEPAGEQPGSAR